MVPPMSEVEFTVNSILTTAFNIPDQNLVQKRMEHHIPKMHWNETKIIDALLPLIANLKKPNYLSYIYSL